jgi:hypothetical protein
MGTAVPAFAVKEPLLRLHIGHPARLGGRQLPFLNRGLHTLVHSAFDFPANANLVLIKRIVRCMAELQRNPDIAKEQRQRRKTMAEKTKLVADLISAENVGPNERSEFALGLAVAL